MTFSRATGKHLAHLEISGWVSSPDKLQVTGQTESPSSGTKFKNMKILSTIISALGQDRSPEHF